MRNIISLETCDHWTLEALLVNGNLATLGNEEHHSLATLQPLDWKRVAN